MSRILLIITFTSVLISTSCSNQDSGSDKTMPPTILSGDTLRVNVATDGSETDTDAITRKQFSISEDGRYVVFESSAANLVGVGNDTNNASDIFIRDTLENTTTLVSVANNGAQGNGDSRAPVISANGRYVAFSSSATNFVANVQSSSNIYVRDQFTGEIALVSISSDGNPGNSNSYYPSISGDGNVVVFFSYSDNLLGVGNDNNGQEDVFVRIISAATTHRVNFTNDGVEATDYYLGGISVNFDGQFVAVSAGLNPVTKSDGVTYPYNDIYVHDSSTMQTSLVSDLSTAATTNSDLPVISGNGRYVAYYSNTGVYIRDLETQSKQLVCKTDNGESLNPTCLPIFGNYMSGDGQFIAYLKLDNVSYQPFYILNNIYIKNVLTGKTTLASVSDDEKTGNKTSGDIVSISSNGSVIAFSSEATNLVENDNNGIEDIFVRKLDSTP